MDSTPYSDLRFDELFDKCKVVLIPRSFPHGSIIAHQRMVTSNFSKAENDHEVFYKLPQPVTFVHTTNHNARLGYKTIHQIVKDTLGQAKHEGVGGLVMHCDSKQKHLKKALEEEGFTLESDGDTLTYSHRI